MNDVAITFLVIAALVVLFVSGRVPVELVAIGASLVLWWVAELSVVYLVSAAVLGAAFLAVAIALRSRVVAGQPEQQWKPMRLFHWSITYLTLLFVMVGVDPLLPW